MVVSYKRELKHNYLIIEPEEVFYDSYEIKMLSLIHILIRTG